MSNKLEFEEFISRVAERHEDIFLVCKSAYSGMRSGLSFHCNTHKKDLFVKFAFQLTSGNPCPDCRLEKKYSRYLARFHEKLEENYPHFICVSPPIEIGGKTTLRCNSHGKFDTDSESIIYRRTNCKGCTGEARGAKTRGSSRIPFSEFKRRFNKRFSNDLTILTKDSEFKNFSSVIEVQCKIKSHPPIHKKAQSWLKSNGCKYCRESTGERLVRLCLQALKIRYETEKRFSTCIDKAELPFDFWLEDYGTLIEFQGKQHTEAFDRWGGDMALKLVKKRDMIKRGWAASNNLKLLYIDSYKTEEIRRILTDSLSQIDPISIKASIKELEKKEKISITERWSSYLTRLSEQHKSNLSFAYTKWKPGLREINYTCLKGHGEKFSDLYALLEGHGCDECSGNYVSKKTFIERSREKFGTDNFDFSNLNYLGMEISANIICRRHGNLNISPTQHLYLAKGCKKCGGKAKDYSDENFLAKAAKKFGEKSRFDYSQVVYKGSSEKIEIICEYHGPFLTMPNDHIRTDPKKPDSYQSGCCPGCVDDLRKQPLSKRIVVEGIVFSSIAEACRKYDIKPATVRKRLNNGCDTDAAFKISVRKDN